MKINKILYSFTAMVALLLLVACSPDKYSLGNADFAPEDLVQGKAFSVTVDEKNTVTLKSLLGDNYYCSWVHPNGRSQGNEVKIQLPFAGKYEVRFGVNTHGGIVYSEPYEFEITTNNMSLLEDPLWTYLTGGVGKSKRWVPVDKDYGVGNCDCPMIYANPDDVLNDGTGSSDIGINHLKPNWSPGFADWFLSGGTNNPYMASYMEFTLDDVKGCAIKEFRGETGTAKEAEGTTLEGKWNLNLSDKNHPVLTFTDSYIMHPIGFDGTCANYTTELYITALTPYLLQVATMRTNSEGPWWLVWCFIAEDVQKGDVVIPSDEVNYITPSTPVLPETEDLLTKLYTTDINGVEYVGKEMTFTVSEDAAYDWLWWNGGSSAEKTIDKWESVVKGNYGSAWAPKWGDDVADIELVLGKEVWLDKDGKKKSAQTESTDKFQGYEYTLGNDAGVYNIDEQKLVFDEEVTFFQVKGDGRTIDLTSKEWQVMKCDPGSELVLGIPAGTDADGNTNSYLVVNLVYKPVTSSTGPTAVPFDASKLWFGLEQSKFFRCQLYNPWGGGNDAIDPANVKLKKDQKISITVQLSGFTFSQTAKMVLCCNRGSEQSWEPDCFGYSRAIDVNSDGTYTVSWTNDTGSTVKWDDGTSALTITMQFDGYATLPDTDYATHCTVESITIE